MKGRTFTFTAAASAILFLATAVAISRDLALHFSRHAIAWELAIRQGRLWLDNQPQMKLQADRRARLDAAMRAIFNREPWGSPAYRNALEDLKRINEPARPQPGQLTAAVLPVQYSLVPLAWILCLTAISPILWLLVHGPPWVRASCDDGVMRRMWDGTGSTGAVTRRLFTALSALSLLLSLATAAVWVRSYVHSDVWDRSIFEDEANWTYLKQEVLSVGRGGISYSRIRHGGPAPGLRPWAKQHDPTVGLLQYHKWSPRYPRFIFQKYDKRWGTVFSWAQYNNPQFGPRPQGYSIEVILPLWCPFLLFAVLTSVPGGCVLRQRRVGRRVARGQCRACGYDLRATPERCPECGAIPGKATV